MNYTIEYILNNIVFACAKGTDLGSSEGQSLEGVHAVLCVKEILKMINDQNISLVESDRPFFENHDQGKDIVVRWADLNGLDSDKEVGVPTERRDFSPTIFSKISFYVLRTAISAALS